jgi:hypothetical protein
MGVLGVADVTLAAGGADAVTVGGVFGIAAVAGVGETCGADGSGPAAGPVVAVAGLGFGAARQASKASVATALLLASMPAGDSVDSNSGGAAGGPAEGGCVADSSG